MLVDVVDRTDVEMVERRSRLRFTLKSFQGLLVVGESFGKEFQCDCAPELEVLGPINHTHTTAAELVQNAVVRHRRADHGSGPKFAGILGRGYEQVNTGAGLSKRLSPGFAKSLDKLAEPRLSIVVGDEALYPAVMRNTVHRAKSGFLRRFSRHLQTHLRVCRPGPPAHER